MSLKIINVIFLQNLALEAAQEPKQSRNKSKPSKWTKILKPVIPAFLLDCELCRKRSVCHNVVSV